MQKKKTAPPVSEINVTPMVDVMLVLLIIFIVITPMLNKGVGVDMVKARNPIKMQAADKEDAILIAVTRNGDTFLGTNKMPPDQMPQKVKDLLTNKLDKTVYIRADSRARYERVVEVVDNIRSAGVDSIGLLTEKDEKNAGKPMS